MIEALPLLLVAIAAGVAAWLSQRSKRKLDDYRRQLEEHGEYIPETSRQRLTRVQRRVEEFRASVPQPPSMSIEEIARAEAEELGLGEIPGAAELPVDVQLLVWRRDRDVRERCDGTVRYELADGAAASEAGVDDVRLVCDGTLRSDDEGGNTPGA